MASTVALRTAPRARETHWPCPGRRDREKSREKPHGRLASDVRRDEVRAPHHPAVHHDLGPGLTDGFLFSIGISKVRAAPTCVEVADGVTRDAAGSGSADSGRKSSP